MHLFIFKSPVLSLSVISCSLHPLPHLHRPVPGSPFSRASVWFLLLGSWIAQAQPFVSPLPTFTLLLHWLLWVGFMQLFARAVGFISFTWCEFTWIYMKKWFLYFWKGVWNLLIYFSYAMYLCNSVTKPKLFVSAYCNILLKVDIQ